jgi:hypothetical protein
MNHQIHFEAMKMEMQRNSGDEKMLVRATSHTLREPFTTL